MVLDCCLTSACCFPFCCFPFACIVPFCTGAECVCLHKVLCCFGGAEHAVGCCGGGENAAGCCGPEQGGCCAGGEAGAEVGCCGGGAEGGEAGRCCGGAEAEPNEGCCGSPDGCCAGDPEGGGCCGGAEQAAIILPCFASKSLPGARKTVPVTTNATKASSVNKYMPLDDRSDTTFVMDFDEFYGDISNDSKKIA